MNTPMDPHKPASPETVVSNYRTMLEDNRQEQTDVKLRQAYAKNLIQYVVLVYPKVRNELEGIYNEFFPNTDSNDQ